VFGVCPEKKYDSANYKNIGEVIGVESGDKDIAEFIRRLVFNTLIGNADMHLKNWSLICRDRRRPELAPAYDFVSTIPYIKDDSMALNYLKSKKMHDFSLELLRAFAQKAKFPEELVLKTAIETKNNFLDLWHIEKNHMPISREVVKIIEGHFARVQLVGEN
jgi:serine/threonine-protein kinase HipA